MSEGTAQQDSPDPTPESQMALVDRHVAQMSEHFESVQVFVTVRSNGNTRSLARGGGNYYANYGAVREWLVRQDEMTRRNVKSTEE